MKRESPARALAWMAAGAVMLAAGAFLGSTTGRRRERGAASDRETGDLGREALEDLADRPVARAVLAESLAAVGRVEALSDTVAGLEARFEAVERSSSAERIDALWQRVLHLEERLELIRSQGPEIPSIDTLVAQAENHLAPRIHSLEVRLDEHHAAIQQLQTQAAQTEANLQKMIAAVEKLADQIARVLPGASARIEPQRETASAAASVGEQPLGAAAPKSPGEAEKQVPFRWKSLALAAVITLTLAGSWATVWREGPRHTASAAAAGSPPSATDRIDSAIAALSRLAQQQPEDLTWKYELGRLCAMKQDWTQAERWYRAVLDDDPHDRRAVESLADVLSHRVPEAAADK